ncbi:hypothetical protein BBO99_00003667 [Phytophthora kernoviae]|uniref:Uncharacterized protein n=1 Tax=Phytophthora kernoviae TaxID=325452 RepID=A0A3R7J2B8_9STRA|nr:hypothetical protein BBI17_003715 [Phytophthora kernoviae]RLN81479.1 hypothetical protein BBO99_00003667 [Phytophthora kernoviae]
MDLSPAVIAVCDRFDAANDLVLDRVNAFLDYSPKWNMMRAALSGHLHLVQRLSRRNPDKFQRCCKEAMDSAAEFGHFRVVQWLHDNRQEGCTTDAMDMAACNGHLEIVQWLHENKKEGCTTNAMDFAAQHGHLKVVQWLHFNRKEGATHYAMDNAATYGHLTVIQWLHRYREEGCSQSALVNALNAGHKEIVQWLAINRKSDCIGKTGFVDYLARRGHWDVLALTDKHPYLQELPFFNVKATWKLTHAADRDHLELVKLLNATVSQRTAPDALDFSVESGHLEVVQCLHSNRKDSCSVDAMDVAAIAYASDSTEVPVAVLFNDVWSYNINCSRFADNGCVNSTWEVLNPGAQWGGCRMTYGAKVCTHPRFGPMCEDYCDDLWLYDFSDGSWTEMIELESSRHDTEILDEALISDIEVECIVNWPSARAGHAAVVFDNAIFIHGGYRTFFPYPTTTSAGAGRGTLGTRGTSFTPFPNHPYYLSDMWKFNITTGVWSQIIPDSDSIPEPRLDHSLIAANDVFILFGGYVSNYYFDDTWQYNASANRWVKQTSFVYPKYPASCTDDLEARRLPFSGNYKAYVPSSSLPDNPSNYYFIAETHYGTLTPATAVVMTGTTAETAPIRRVQAPFASTMTLTKVNFARTAASLDLSTRATIQMASYGGGYGQSRHGLMVEEDEDEDMYEGFNFSIDLAPPQTASNTNYMASSYGAPASRGGYNPPGTAFRAPPSQMGRQIPGSRLGTSQQPAGEARPMTSVSGAGFSSNPRTASGQRVFDPMGEGRKAGAAPALVEKTENSPKEVAKELERTVNSLIEQSAELISKEQYEEALHLAKDAGRKERAFNKHCELNGLADLLNIDLTYAVFFSLANAYHLNGLWKEAIQSYTPIVKNKQYAQGGRLRVNMGNIYFEQQQFPTAIRMYRMALDQIPNTSKEVRYKIKRNIGAAQIKLGHYQDASTTFEDIMEGNADFQSGFNLIICYYAIGEHEKMRRGFTNLITIPMEGMSEEEEEDSGLVNESKDDNDHTTSKEHLHSLKADGLKAEIRARRKKAMEYILVAAKLCAPALDKKDWLAGFTWVIDALKQENHESLASEMEICKAHWFLKEKEFDKAIEVLKAFEKKDPAHKAMAATNLSYLYFVEGDTAQADKYASLAVRHQRYNAKALVNKGNCLYVKNECERAKELFLEAIGVEADCIEAIYNLGLVNIKMGVLNEALQAFEKLHSIVPSNAEVLYQIANLHDTMGNYRQAAKWFNILLSCFGGTDKRDRNSKNVADPGVLARLGQIFNKDDDETQAFHYHLESYRYFPINLDVISWLGVWYVKSELYEKAIQFFERASQIQPSEVKWRLMVTSCYRRMGAYQKAMVLYEQIHQDYPENLECLRYLVAICKDLGQRCDGFQTKLAKLERDNAVNTKVPPQQQQAPPVDTDDWGDADVGNLLGD